MTSPDIVQARTSEKVNRRIHEDTRQRVVEAAADPREAISARIEALEREWDIERWLETNASALALTGTILGLTVNRRFFAIPCMVLTFLFQHAVQGWCPPLPFLRRLGVRTRREIDEEKFALKALRGDFETVRPSEEGGDHGEKAWQAATT